MSTIEINGKTLYYEESGAGKPVVLVHSALMNSTMWDQQVAAFAPHYRVIRYDLYGYGKSPFTDQKIVDHPADLKALLDHLGIEKAVVLGASMGGEMVMNFALEHPGMTEALILVGSGLEGYEYPEEAFAWWGDFIGAIRERNFPHAIETFINNAIDSRSDPLTPELRIAIVNAMQTYSFQHYFDETLLWWTPDQEPATRLGAITCPTLVMVGAGDTQVMLDIAAHLAEKLPTAKKVIIPRAGHLVNLQQPEAFNREVLEFLKQLP